jgi:hypothetical protein
VSAPWIAELAEVIGEDRWGAHRLAALSARERSLYASILRRFAAGPPGQCDDTGPVPDDRADALAGLVERDLVGVDPDGAVVVAYPFSARATRHRVDTHDGRRLWAMCAIDAFAIPYLLGRSAAIHAREPGTDRPVTVTMDPGSETLRSHPADATVAAARAGGGGVAECVCPHINLFASRRTAERYLDVAGRRGTVLSIPDAAAAARAIFGALSDLPVTPSAIGPNAGGRRPASGVRSAQS